MPSINLTPNTNNPDAGTLSVDGNDVINVTVGVNGNVVLDIPSTASGLGNVYFTRSSATPQQSGVSGISDDPTDVHADLVGKPRISITKEAGTPASPSPGARPLMGQDSYLYDIMYALKSRTNTIVYGPTGCGKTASIEWVTAILGWNLVIVSVTPGANEDTMVGTQLPAAHDKTGAPTIKWHDRQIATAARISHDRPTVLLIDEINRIRDVNEYAALMPLLDGTARLTLPTGEVIDRGDLVLVATANPPHEYVGTNELDPAFENRLQWTPTIDYPHPVDEALALQSLIPTLDPHVAKTMCDVAKRIREAQDIMHPIGFRSLATWAEAMDSGCYTWSEAAERALVAKFPPDERQPVRNVMAMFAVGDDGLPLS